MHPASDARGDPVHADDTNSTVDDEIWPIEKLEMHTD
jgi:hypothetical protein